MARGHQIAQIGEERPNVLALGSQGGEDEIRAVVMVVIKFSDKLTGIKPAEFFQLIPSDQPPREIS